MPLTPAHTLSRSVSLSNWSSLLLSSVLLTARRCLFLGRAVRRSPTQLSDTALRLAAWREAAAQRYPEWSWKHLWLAARAQSTTPSTLTHSLSHSLARSPPPPTEGGKGGRKGGTQTDREWVRDRCGGGSLCRIVN